MLKLLCIEDDPHTAKYISSIPDKNKYAVTIIYDGQKALDFLSETDPLDGTYVLD